MKPCPKCTRTLPLTDFYNRPEGGIHSWCKVCMNKKSKDFENERRDPEAIAKWIDRVMWDINE